ncbi:centrosomal protein of 192 kDa [Ammospiza caudacuta]|uniref:centrosomal protein of 192 kDa n=1 Tax=Ammospiza caudacuta TaxID=2857398 RepID=UPI0027391020|nr:centrosomal protein of 192 kDa [Ammospiza caudacuta]
MFVARSIAADHRDLIHDVSFDFHGRRMATCSSDQSVKVWDKSENGDWHCTASWKTHSGSVWRVTWAHPEFGQVLASCSFDRTAAVWEEIVGESNDKLRGQSHWVKRTTLVDSRTSVTDVKFAPKHMGLMLATCSADGVVRIYEAPDVMNLSQWSLQHEISCKLSCSCISWNPSSSRAHSPMIAVGSDDNSPNILAKVQIYEYNENTRKYAKAEALMTVTDPVHDIAFAPNLGRSFHILAVATKDVRIFTLKPLRKELTSSGGLTKFEIHIVAQFDNHNSQVWRVSWNITGTVLASSGDDGCVRLWKANYMDNWKCTGILKGNGSPVNGSSQQGIFNASLGSANTSLQNSLNGSSASRYFFPPLDSPRAGSRWSSHAQLLPPPPLIEQSCDADTANLQYPLPRRRCVSRPLNLLPENEGVPDEGVFLNQVSTLLALLCAILDVQLHIPSLCHKVGRGTADSGRMFSGPFPGRPGATPWSPPHPAPFLLTAGGAGLGGAARASPNQRCRLPRPDCLAPRPLPRAVPAHGRLRLGRCHWLRGRERQSFGGARGATAHALPAARVWGGSVARPFPLRAGGVSGARPAAGERCGGGARRIPSRVLAVGPSVRQRSWCTWNPRKGQSPSLPPLWTKRRSPASELRGGAWPVSSGSLPAAARRHTELGSPQVLPGGAAEGGRQAGTARSGRLYTLNIGWHVSQRRWSFPGSDVRVKCSGPACRCCPGGADGGAGPSAVPGGMMEDFRGIADETFPSYLGQSLNSSASVLFENVTVSSNPGLPVAASTVARSQDGSDNRLPDDCASYLEGKHSPLSRSSHSSQSHPEPMERVALCLHDDMEIATQIEDPQPSCVNLKESHSIYGEQPQNVVEHSNHSQSTLREFLPVEQLKDLPTGICFLPDVKNSKVGPSEPSEKLMEGVISSVHLSNSLSSFLENEKLSSLLSTDEDSTGEDIDDEEFDNKLEAYFEQLIQPEIRRDTNLQNLSEHCAALKLSENVLLKESFKDSAGYGAVTEIDSGSASDEDSQNEGITGCPVQKQTLPRAVQQMNSVTAEDVLDSCTAAELRLDSLYLQCMDSHKADVSDVLPKQELESSVCQATYSDAEVLHTARGFLGRDTTPELPSANAPQADATQCKAGLPDTYLSPAGDSYENLSLATTDKGDLPHSIVYQNEEGKWVTDLAYYTAFDEEQDLNMSEDDKGNEEFVTGSEAAAMIAQDQEEFEKAHRLMQAGKVGSLNASELANTSWRSANSFILPRTSDLHKDASYLRLSLGEFFGQRSEALGCLGGGSDVKRPSFGYYITSPKKRQPVPLLMRSDSSGGDIGREISQLSEVFSDDLEAQTKNHANFTSSEGSGHRVDTAAGMRENINTEAATKSKAKDGIHKGKFEDSLSNNSDSVLSISTIANAIANASSSAEPSQLAAMMMALSNKSKRTRVLPRAVKEAELSTNEALSSNEENSTFDMEKYLKKTDENRCESEYESVVKHEASVQNLTSDTFLVGKEKHKDAFAEDWINNHSKQQGIEKRLLHYLSEEGDSQNFSSLSGVPSHRDVNADNVRCSEKLSDLVNRKHLQPMDADIGSETLNENEAHTCGILSAAKLEVARQHLLAYQNSNLTNACSIGEDRETADQTANAVPEPCNDLVERSAGNTVSLSNLKPAKQLSKCVSVSPTAAKPVQKLNSDDRRQNTEKRNKDASTPHRGNAKHVTFEKLSPTFQTNTEHKPVLPECDLNLEGEQCSFRPSTSPLIHSSPSETSGTAFSGSEVDFTYPSRCQGSPCKENVVPQSVYSSPSMSRLTYVSASGSARKNSAVMHSPETSWDEDAGELSTTIIQASPVSLEERRKENLEDRSCQRNRKKAILSTDQEQEENELAGLQRKPHNVLDQELAKEGFLRMNQLPFIPSNVPANHEEPDSAKSALPSQLCTFPPLSVNMDAQELCQDQTNKAQRQGLPVYSGLSTCLPCKQNPSGEQHVHISTVKSHVTTSESQAIPSSVPTLLTGHCLATAPVAQQHLEAKQPPGNAVLSHFHGCNAAGFGLPAGLPCSGIPVGHVENPLMLGIPLGPNIGPGFLGAASLYNPHSTSWNNNILNIKPCTGQPLGAGGREWELSKSPGIGHIKVPEELKFPTACCVGIASQTVLSVYNPTDRWLQVNIGILSVSVNGERMDPMKYPCLVFKNKTIVGPYSTNDLKILFLPSRSGIFQCILNVSSWPVSADAETIVQSEALASRVVLTAVAENPNLEVETGKEDCLDFGDLPFGNLKALPLKLINKTHAFMPIRLIINANAVAWRCFTFSKEPVNTSNEQMDAVSQTAAPSVVNHVIHASYDGQDPEALTVWVLFHAPKKQISSSDSLGPAEEFLARVDVEVDSPGPSTVIKSIFLRARAGTARIRIPKDLEKIHLSASVGSTVKQQLPLVNSGNISVHLKVQISDQDICFAVKPEDLFLFPGEEQVVTVQFFPKSTTTTESILKILVLPSGPQFEVMIEGEVESGQNRPVSTPARCSDIPPILSNKQFIAWGAVSLGSSVQKKLILRNDSPSVPQHLRLLIRGQDQDSFQLQSIFGSEQRLTSSWELRMRPKEDTNIYLMFTPTRVTCCFAKLEIKQLGIQSKPGIKFTIPLSGYGGASNIILENVKKLSDSFLVTLECSLSARSQKASFHVRNTGSRAAYVKVLCLGNLHTKTMIDPQVMRVSPEQFVLREGTHEVVTVTWNPMEKNFSPSMVVSTLCLFWGDEVSRQQYRRAVMYKAEVEKRIIPENNLVRNAVFDEEFQGEQLVTEVCDVPRETNDIHLFYANMQKILLSVVGYSTCDQDDFQQSTGSQLELDRLENFVTHTAATLDVLPVKGPQGTSLSAKNNDLAQNKSDAQETWAVTPEYLILTSPTLGETSDTRRVQILNNSNRMLAFELSWPAHCLTVTPQHGDVEPGASTLILVSPNPSLATRPILIPWSGLICIHCDNGLKFIKVLIQEAGTQSVSGSDLPCRRCDIITPQPENPTVDVPKLLPRFPLTEMHIRNRNIAFPKTRPGQSSENYLEMENKGNENLKWKISSFAPPYIKGVDGSGTVYRVPYSAFGFSHVSGTLEVHEQEKVAVIFSPRDTGDYSQFWDLEYYSVGNPSRKYKLKFQLSGNSTKAENETPVVKSSPSALKKTELVVTQERKAYPEGQPKRIKQKEVIQGVYAPEDVYVFPLTRVGEACTLKVHLRNNSRTTHMLKFVSPREPFYIRHLKYSLRSCHYIAVPVQFKPKVEGMFEDVFVVLTSKYGPIKIRLYGKAIAEK